MLMKTHIAVLQAMTSFSLVNGSVSEKCLLFELMVPTYSLHGTIT